MNRPRLVKEYAMSNAPSAPTQVRQLARQHIISIEHWARADYGLRGQELRASAAFIAELMQRVEDIERTGTTTATPSPACWAAGAPVNLAAAAEDADEWLALIERLHEAGRWQFSQRDTLSKLQGCRRALRSHLRALSEVEQNHDTPA